MLIETGILGKRASRNCVAKAFARTPCPRVELLSDAFPPLPIGIVGTEIHARKGATTHVPDRAARRHSGRPRSKADAAAKAQEAEGLKSITLSPREAFDLEMIAIGAFSPLTGFMGEADFKRVCTEMRLANGTVWPIPVILSPRDDVAAQDQRRRQLALNDARAAARRHERHGKVQARQGAGDPQRLQDRRTTRIPA
jgi:hypothetical protein